MSALGPKFENVEGVESFCHVLYPLLSCPPPRATASFDVLLFIFPFLFVSQFPFGLDKVCFENLTAVVIVIPQTQIWILWRVSGKRLIRHWTFSRKKGWEDSWEIPIKSKENRRGWWSFLRGSGNLKTFLPLCDVMSLITLNYFSFSSNFLLPHLPSPITFVSLSFTFHFFSVGCYFFFFLFKIFPLIFFPNTFLSTPGTHKSQIL